MRRSHVMVRKCLLFTVVASLLILCASRSKAQFSFGVTRQNGIVTGGGLRVGGFVTPGRTGVRLGVSTGVGNLIGINTFKIRNGRKNRGLANNNRQRQPSSDQFVRAAARFDLDQDDRLDQEELTQVASAVLAELKQLQRRKKRKSASWSRKTGKQAFPSSQLSSEQLVEAFVARCMEFDTDDDNALNAAETKRMATALIRSLS